MLALGIILLVLAGFLIVVTVVAETNDWDCGIGWIGYLAGAALVLGLVLLIVATDNKPTAMDVYQGKTTLQYTIVDSVKVDSVVVWKNKK